MCFILCGICPLDAVGAVRLYRAASFFIQTAAFSTPDDLLTFYSLYIHNVFIILPMQRGKIYYHFI